MIMINRRPTIIDVDNLMLNNGDSRTPHEGVFSGCIGDLNSEYLDNTWSVLRIEEIILDYYRYDGIAFETWQEFQNSLKNVWNRNFLQLKQNIENSVEFELGMYKIVQDETIKDQKTENVKIDTQRNGTSTNSGDYGRKYSDTPNEYISNEDNFNGLTNISMDTEKTNGTQNETTNGNSDGESLRDYSKKVTRTRHANDFDKWLQMSRKNRNIIYDFVDKFEILFSRTTTIISY